MDLPDATLVQATLAGDHSAFESLVQRHQSNIFALARRRINDPSEAADLVQDIFLKTYQNLASWRGDAPFEHWLLRVATRVCYDHLRSARRQREQPISQLSDDESEWIARNATAHQPDSHDSDAARSLVAKALSRLSPSARLVLTLLEIEDRTVKEIAALTGWSIPLVKVRAFRARAEMRRVLSRMGVEKYL